MFEPIKANTTGHNISFSNIASRSIRVGLSSPGRRRHAVQNFGTAGSAFAADTVWERNS